MSGNFHDIRKNDSETEFKGSYTNNIQGAKGSYAKFVGILTEAIKRQDENIKIQNVFTITLVFDNANKCCQVIL